MALQVDRAAPAIVTTEQDGDGEKGQRVHNWIGDVVSAYPGWHRRERVRAVSCAATAYILPPARSRSCMQCMASSGNSARSIDAVPSFVCSYHSQSAGKA
eukprot:COSAG03_NODE_89_length_13462_cov_21.049764_11_plen_100_part_00